MKNSIFPLLLSCQIHHCTERIIEIIVFGIEVYIPHSSSSLKAHKPWFNLTCSRAIHDRVVVYKRCLSFPSPDTHVLYISAQNHAKSVLQLIKNSFTNKKCQNLSSSNSPRDFWHLANNIFNNFFSSSFPPLLHPDCTPAISTVSKAELFAQTYADNSTSDDSRHVSPSPPHSDYFYLILKSFVIVFLVPLLALTLGRHMVLMESLLLISRTVFLCSHLAWSNFSVSAHRLPPIFAGSMPTYNLFQKRMTSPIPQTTVLLL